MNPVYELNLEKIKKADLELYNMVCSTQDDESIEIVQSQKGYPVPRINGIMIHSSFDPLKEASVFIKSCETIIKAQDIYLVMGYGFGYHVDALIERIKEEQNKFIFIIEPNLKLFKKVLALRDLANVIDNVSFIVGYSIPRLFDLPGFYKILNAAPYMIGYNPAVKMSEDYFVEFVKRRSSNKKEHLMVEADENEELINVLQGFENNEEVTVNKVIKKILDKTDYLTKADKIFLLLGEISR